MAQYCRYCTYFCTGNGNYCEKKGTFPTDKQAKRTNKCKLFDLCAIDAFFENEKEYTPRIKSNNIKSNNIKNTDNQICMF